ncbi:MAG: 2-polyprenyl-3-methyl-6-methoxy-1,4-benzoquinone monooxygenase [Steroidobacteraceae bacterium]|nr:2-polyprenyl-3-methyl-6-methoxy-1,4-benzoquinone monooxygenase [Steroidobacteraceae bacterium]MDW8260363.1 2-polyprenyl-3-methyl-6-methoxy-1,4-benzoquinone monooxygenase [Gammaproteobacteria bacterium]
MNGAAPFDDLIVTVDRALRALFSPAHGARPTPGEPEGSGDLSEAERAESAALMRVNHTGELAAQALYHGQALLARDAQTRAWLLRAAREEADHLAWCEQRIAELGGRTSRLNPLFYAGSFAIGALAAALGDRASLSFVSETERQVEKHLDEHLARLPANDRRSRAVLESMRQDEMMHGANARAAGGGELPQAVKWLMKAASFVMTVTTYRV